MKARESRQRTPRLPAIPTSSHGGGEQTAAPRRRPVGAASLLRTAEKGRRRALWRRRPPVRLKATARFGLPRSSPVLWAQTPRLELRRSAAARRRSSSRHRIVDGRNQSTADVAPGSAKRDRKNAPGELQLEGGEDGKRVATAGNAARRSRGRIRAPSHGQASRP